MFEKFRSIIAARDRIKELENKLRQNEWDIEALIKSKTDSKIESENEYNNRLEAEKQSIKKVYEDKITNLETKNSLLADERRREEAIIKNEWEVIGEIRLYVEKKLMGIDYKQQRLDMHHTEKIKLAKEVSSDCLDIVDFIKRKEKNSKIEKLEKLD